MFFILFLIREYNIVKPWSVLYVSKWYILEQETYLKAPTLL